MKSSDIAHLRLRNLHLTEPTFKKAADVVRWLGAVQSQDFASAKFGVAVRMKNAVDRDIEDAFNKGEILRTHVMRPTWHFVMPEDIRWMLELTAPRVKSILSSYDRGLELTEKVLSRCSEIFIRLLKGGKNLTRTELAEHLEKNKILARGQRLARIVMHAELNAVLCSGPRKGKQLSYALLDERVSQKTKELNREEALSKLMLKYFASHGPAQSKDFYWWSGLSAKDVTQGLEIVKSKLVREEIDGKTYWMTNDAKVHSETPAIKHQAFFLSIYDEYTIAYKDRSALGDGRYAEKFLSMGNALTSVIIINGKLEGTWKKAFKKSGVEIRADVFRKLNKSEQQALKKAAERYGQFLELPVELVM